MKHKNIIEFLWGSPIVTEKSDEDWLIIVDKKPETFIRYTPQLAGPRTRYIDGTGKLLQDFPDFLYKKPFYNVISLFSKEYYFDEAAPQIETLVALREDIALMNLPEMYSSFQNYASQAEIRRSMKSHTPKITSKLVQNYVIMNEFANGASFEEARARGIACAVPIKLNLIPQEMVEDILKDQQLKFNEQKVFDFFQKEPNTELYAKIGQIIESIDTSKLSGIAVKGQFLC